MIAAEHVDSSHLLDTRIDQPMILSVVLEYGLYDDVRVSF